MEGSLGNVDGTDGSAWREALIEELVNPRPWLGRPVAESRDELICKDDQELRRLGAATREERARGQPPHMVIEELVEFYESRYAVDFAIWNRKVLWSIDEATAILCSLNPDMVKLKNINEIARNSRLGNYFKDVYDRLDRATKARQLLSMDKPQGFLDWAVRNDIIIPPALSALLRLPQTAKIEVQELTRLRTRVVELEADLAEARAEIARHELAFCEKLHHSRKAKMQMMIYIWVKSIVPKFDPNIVGTDAIPRLQQQFVKHNLSIDDEPLRETIKEAFFKIKELKSFGKQSS